MSKVAVVTGGTSGIGKQTALALKAAGYTVYELSRRAQGVEGLHHLVADITREELVDAAIGEVLRQEGHIDVVVNNAGFGISGAIEFTKTEDANAAFDADEGRALCVLLHPGTDERFAGIMKHRAVPPVGARNRSWRISSQMEPAENRRTSWNADPLTSLFIRTSTPPRGRPEAGKPQAGPAFPRLRQE